MRIRMYNALTDTPSTVFDELKEQEIIDRIVLLNPGKLTEQQVRELLKKGEKVYTRFVYYRKAGKW